MRACDPQITALCILGSIKEVVGQLLVAGGSAVDRDLLAREIINYNLSGLFQAAPTAELS